MEVMVDKNEDTFLVKCFYLIQSFN